MASNHYLGGRFPLSGWWQEELVLPDQHVIVVTCVCHLPYNPRLTYISLSCNVWWSQNVCRHSMEQHLVERLKTLGLLSQCWPKLENHKIQKILRIGLLRFGSKPVQPHLAKLWTAGSHWEVLGAELEPDQAVRFKVVWFAIQTGSNHKL